jgi:hypothetical protein
MSEQTHQTRVAKQPQPASIRGNEEALYTPDRMLESLPNEATHQPPLTPHNVLKLQRLIGNQAVQRQYAPQRTPKPRQFISPLIQREEPDSIPVPAGNVYEYKAEYKGDRWSFSLAFSFSKTDTSPLKDKAGPASGQIGESKMGRSYNAGSGKSANAISLALAKSSLDIEELAPGIKVKADLKAMEAKLENGDVDVDVFKVAVGVEANLTQAIQGTEVGDAILATELGEVIMNGTAVKVTGKVEIKIDPSDVARLVRMAKLNKEMIKNAEAAAKLGKKAEALEAENKKIRDKLAKRGKDMKATQRAQLKKRMKLNNEKLGKLQKLLKDNKAATKVVKEAFEEAATGLKTKAGRIVGGIVKKVGGRLLMRAIPVIGWLLTALDVGTILYGLFAGELEFGFGGGGEGGGDSDGGEATDGGTTGGDIPGGVPDDALDGGTGDTGTDTDGGMHGGSGTGSAGGDTALGPEIDISEDEAFVPSTGLAEDGGVAGEQPELHPAAAAVLEAIKSDSGVKFSNDDIAQLNGVVPEDLSGDHLTALLDWIKANKTEKPADAFEVLGALQTKISRLQNPPEDAVVTDPSGEMEAIPVTEVPGAAPEEEAESTSPELEEIQKAIAGAKQVMKAKKLYTYSVLPEDAPTADKMQSNTVIRSWVYFNHNGKYIGGPATMIVVERVKGDWFKVQFQPMRLYEEDGGIYGELPGVTLELEISTP